MYKIIDEYKINYVEKGEGKHIVLLHGWGSNLKCFSPLVNLLSTKYKVYALDLPGFGESDALRKSFSVDDYADIVEKFISEVVQDKEVIFIGHSYGGRIILKLNNRSNLPFVIQKNVLIDAAGIKDKRDIKTKFKIFIFKFCKNLFLLLPISKIKKENLIDDLRKKFGSSDYSNASDIMKETLVKSVNEDLTPCISSMKETLLIWGDKDTATPLWMAKKMEKGIKNAGLVVLKGGHFSFIDDSFTFANVIASYFKL